VLLRVGDGWGEAAPLPSYDGVDVDQVVTALSSCRDLLEAWDGDPEGRAPLLARCSERVLLAPALAAVDLALWDHCGRALGAPVWSLLGAAGAPPLEVNATVVAADRAGAASEAARAAAAGFPCVKLKVGIGDDAGRVAAVRAALGRDVAIRLDANGAWSVDEALAWLRALAPAGIELCEEPVHGLDALQAVAAAAEVPIALDESGALPGALDHRYGQAVCLKLGRCGGISGLLAAAARARATGYEVYIASTYDGPLGIAAALHACAAVQPDRPCGLATLGLFATGREAPQQFRAGRISLAAGSGLGDGLRDWYGSCDAV
jgi:L-alanine-DL-glutamate epimerase-like enolase superfamily enzyme